MPWYKSGTISVAQNSNAVVGTGTAFLVNGRVGDAFRGPDGAWYEVTNIVSDTSLAISPNYLGASNSEGSYALAPMQGYVKDSADALRALVNTYGSKLAALGTTGNYEVLPLSKGGTGGTDQATARTSLGLGTVAIENTVPLSKGGTGGTDQATARTGLGLGTVATESTVPVAKGGTGGTDQATARTNLGLGTVATENTVPIAKGGTGGTTQAAARSNLGLKLAALADIFGIVSQSGGVPTGAIIESGSNANGRYVKFADGTMICTHLSGTGVTSSAAAGQIFISGATTFTFPVAFTSAPRVVGASVFTHPNGANAGSQTGWDKASSSTLTQCFVVVWGWSNLSALFPGYIAIGRWFE
jgi:hypothetical protein